MNKKWILPLLAFLLTACPIDKITNINAVATPSTVTSAGSSSLNATVNGTGTFNQSVNWSVVSGGGTLSSSTGASVTYTAPIVSSSTTVQIKAAAVSDSSVSKTLLITVQPFTSTPSKPMINTFSATPTSLTAAGQVTLIWDVSDATSLTIDSGVGTVTGTSKVVSVTSSTTYTLTATNASGSSTKSVGVTVASLPAPPTVVSVSPASGATGVSADAKIVVTFSKPMDQAVTQAAYQSASLPASGVTFDWDASGTVLTVTPNTPLVYATGTDPKVVVATIYAFSITSTAEDKLGNALVPVNSSFKTLREITASLQSEAVRDGYVESGGSYDTTVDLYVGDSSNNSGVRGFLSFDLSSLPNSLTSSDLVSGMLNLYKAVVTNDPYTDLHDPCTPACLTTRVILDHVTYGITLDSADYYTPKLEASGYTDGLSVPIGYVTSDVLTSVRDDVTNRITRENRSQYRLGFPLISDGDSKNDNVSYGAAESNFGYRPSLVLKYQIP